MKAVKFNYVRSERTKVYIDTYKVFEYTTHADQIKAIKMAVKACYETLAMLNKIDDNWYRVFPTAATQKFHVAHPFCHMAFEDVCQRMSVERKAVEHSLEQLEAIQHRIINA